MAYHDLTYAPYYPQLTGHRVNQDLSDAIDMPPLVRLTTMESPMDAEGEGCDRYDE